MYIYIYIYIYTVYNVFVYIYIYIYMYVCVCVYIYIYTEPNLTWPGINPVTFDLTNITRLWYSKKIRAYKAQQF